MDPGLQQLQQEIAAAINGMTAEQRSTHPEGKWCATEVLEHLYLTYTGTIKGLSRVLESGTVKTKPSTWADFKRRIVVLGLGYLPSGREAPAHTLPRGLRPGDVLAEIGEKIAQMDEMIRRCEERFGKRNRLLDHPILGPLTGAQWRKFHLVHGRHHLKQVRRLRGMVEYGSS